MSAFLGKIHYWLYNKILFGEKLQKDVLGYAKNKNISVNSITKEAYSKYGEPNFSPLEEVIDQGNIHGWLQSRIDSLEYRLANLVTILVNEHGVSIEELSEVFRTNGENTMKFLGIEEFTPATLFSTIFDHLVEGMPCDRVNQLESNSDNEIVWSTTTCVHSRFWEAVQGDVTNYYKLKEAWIEGFISALNGKFTYEHEGNISKIKRA